MKARQVIEEILSKAFKRGRFPVSLKAEAVLLYLWTEGFVGINY
jgi:hypothetical protein